MGIMVKLVILHPPKTRQAIFVLPCLALTLLCLPIDGKADTFFLLGDAGTRNFIMTDPISFPTT